MESMGRLMLEDFYKNKKVFVTGHTGFKGSWICRALMLLGADVYGYALEPPTSPSLFDVAKVGDVVHSTIADIRNMETLQQALSNAAPDIVIHMAAQPIVRDSYQEPVYTYETNVMGTAHILEVVRHTGSVRSFLNVTTDKVYQNNEWFWGYRETDRLNGYDPYSNSKSCSELVTDSYKKSFFGGREIAISTARAGNVIGGGDFANDRIVPDCVRAVSQGVEIVIRNPYSVRPYQHVLEPVYAYLTIMMRQYKDSTLAGSYNIGPDDRDCVTTGDLATIFCDAWGQGAGWKTISEEDAVHEANFLKLDCSKAKSVFGIGPRWNIVQAIEKTVEWYQCYTQQGDTADCMDRQITEYFRG